MHDLFFIFFLVTLFAFGFRRPFLFVLTYAYIDIVSPQRLTYYLLNSVPISLIAVGLSVLGWAAMDDKKDLRIAPRQVLILILLAYCGWTTINADFPLEARDKWDWVWKALAFAAFLPLTLRTKLRIEAMLLFMILSAGSIIIVGGIKTIFSGGGYGELDLMVNNNSGLYEGSTISTVAICIIPIILWLAKFGTIFKPGWKVSAFAIALIFACLLIPVGTSTRTGLLCAALLGVLTLRSVKRPLLYVGAIALVGTLAVPFLPKAYTERMGTIKTYQGDASASTRVAVWQWTMDYAKTHPFGGGFEAYRQDQIRYEKVNVTDDGSGNTTVTTTLEVDKARAYHSAYFEMLGEQGYVGLAMWVLLNIAGIVRMEVLRQRYKRAGPDEQWIAPLAAALQNAQIVYMLGACFIAIAFQPFIYMLIGAQIGLDTYCARKRADAMWRPLRRQKPQAAAA